MSTTTPTTETDSPNDDDSPAAIEPAVSLAVLGGDGDYDGTRDEKAHEETIALAPDFDSYGEVPKQTSATYTAYSGSGSEYTVSLTGEETCNCMDAIMNSPESGCKHVTKLMVLLNDGAIPAPREQVDQWVRDALYDRVIEAGVRLTELRTARQAAREADDPAHDPSDYDDPIEAATAVFEGLRETYQRYRDDVDSSVPPIPSTFQ